MSGHSKWHKIQHKKAITDSKKSKLFGSLSREIKIAARQGTDPATNSDLREAIERAKKANLPQENIDRLLSRDTESQTEAWYEGYGSGGAAILVSTATDNTNRTVTELRTLFKQHGGSLGSAGSVKWKFTPTLVISARLTQPLSNEAELMLIDAGASDVKQNELELTITAPPESHSALENALKQSNSSALSFEIRHIAPPDQCTILSAEDSAIVAELVSELESHPDVTAVYTDQA